MTPVVDVSIQPATRTHVAVLAALHRLCFDGQQWHRPWSDVEMGEVLGLPGAQGWLALAGGGEAAGDEGTPVGLLLVQITGPDADLLTIGVCPGPWRRRGVGGLLMRGAEAALHAQGVERLVLEVADDNIGALRFYGRLGYERVGRRPGYYGGACGEAAGGPGGARCDAIVMAGQVRAGDGVAERAGAPR